MANKAYRVRDMQTGDLMDLLLVSNGDSPETWSLATSGASGSASATIAGPLGRRSDATSVSVAVSTEDAALIGSLTETAPASDTASSGMNGRLQRIAQRLTSLIALLPGSIGQKAKAAALAVSLSSDEDLLGYVGIVTETAPATDTASSGLNGRLQRVAQRMTSLIALIPAALGQGTMAQSLRVVLASDQSAVPTTAGSSTKATYMAAATALAPAVAATDIFIISGSASKTVKVLGIAVSGVATAAGAYDFNLIKRSTANSGGTSSAPAVVPLDSANAAGTAVVLAYTANPTLGTGVGTIISRKATVTTAAGAIPEVPLLIAAGQGQAQEIVLRGVAESLCLSLNATTMTGGALNIDILWTEE